MKKKTFWLIAATVALAILLTFIVALFFVGDPFYNKGLEIIDLMDDAIESEEYLTIYGNSYYYDRFGDYVDHDKPESVYKITITDEALIEYTEYVGLDIGGMPEALLDKTLDKIHSTMGQYLLSRIGSNIYNASISSSVSTTFVGPSQNAIYLYTYEDAYPAIVVFTGGDGLSVSATGYIIFNSEDELDSLENIESIFSEFSVDVEILKD